MRRPCIEAGCSFTTAATRCTRHHALYMARRAANYGATHRALRTELGATLPGPCFYCGDTVTAETFVAAHLRDGDPASPRVVAHRSCNERAKPGVGSNL